MGDDPIAPRLPTTAQVHGFFTKLSMGAAYQLQSRDVYRVCKLLPLERRMSLFLSAFGFYVSNAVTMYSVQMTAFLFALLAVSNLLTTYAINKVQMSAEIINVFDREAADIAYWYGSRTASETEVIDDVHYHPVVPRTLRLGVRYAL